jgi:uncharacterized protein YjiS (DUF1127 family)
MRLAQASLLLLTQAALQGNRDSGAHGSSSRIIQVGSTIVRSLAAVRERIRARNRERAAIEHLLQLDSHLLRDIGVDHTEIRIAVREGRLL